MKIQSLLATVFAITSLHAQPAADPYRATPPDGAPPADGPVNLSICFETFSLPLTLAAKMQRENISDSALYGRLIASTGKDGIKQETFTISRARSGEKADANSVVEEIYSTEYEPPQLPTSVGVALPVEQSNEPVPAPKVPAAPDAAALAKAQDIARFQGLKTPATPTSFETRNVGLSFEIAPTLAENRKIVDLRLAPELVTSVGRTAWGQDLSETEMPVFETQRINSSATVGINSPFLIGTFNRPPVSKVDPDSADRVWFAFVTATLAKP